MLTVLIQWVRAWTDRYSSDPWLRTGNNLILVSPSHFPTLTVTCSACHEALLSLALILTPLTRLTMRKHFWEARHEHLCGFLEYRHCCGRCIDYSLHRRQLQMQEHTRHET